MAVISCSNTKLLIQYAQKHGIPLPALLKGVDTPPEILANKLAWTEAWIWTRMIQNIFDHPGGKGTTAYGIGCEIARDLSNFQFLFLRIAPISFIIGSINRHVKNSFDRNLDIGIKVRRDGEGIITVRPIDSSTYTPFACDFIKGIVVTLLSLKGYRGVTLTEEQCAARDGAVECEYHIRWKARPGLFRRLQELLARFRYYHTVIAHMEQNHNAMQEQFLFLQALLDTIPSPIFCKDVNSRFIECNAAYEAFVQLPKSDIIGRTVRDFATEEIASIHEERDAELLSSGKPLVYEALAPSADGKLHHAMLHKAPFRRADGSIAGIVGIITDLTQRREAEEAKARLEKSLMQAQKMEALGSLAGGIAHDFNNILVAIIGYCELAMHNLPVDHPSRNVLKQLLKAGDRAGHLVKQILSFSRRDENERKPFLLRPAIDEVLELLRASLPSTIELRRRFSEKPRPVLADPTQIHQVLMNLCTNGAHAMNARGGVLEVALDDVLMDEVAGGLNPGQKPGYYERITVTDTGHGIDRETLGRIFEPYFTTKGPGRGTGLGLSVVHGIVESHGGFVNVSSDPGKGTAFSVYLPALPEPEAEDISKAPGAGKNGA